MTTTISSKGQIVLPADIRQQDDIKPGQKFDVERIDRGEYLLKRKARRRNGRMPPGRRRQRFERWFDQGVVTLVCLPVEAATGIRWAKLLARLRAAGDAMPFKDSLIAATALVYGLTVATRNTRDFQKAGVKVIDPFT